MNNVMWDVFFKELKEIFREKKTIMTALLIPFLIYPIMFGAMGMVSKDMDENIQNMKVAVSSAENSKLLSYFEKSEGIEIVRTENIIELVDSGKVRVGILLDENFDKSIENGEAPDIKVYLDETSTESSMTASRLQSYVKDYSNEIVKNRLKLKGIEEDVLVPFNIIEKSVNDGKESRPNILILMLAPFAIVMVCVTGPMPAANDLGAGEKERGTLEPLLLTGATKGQILTGKILAISVIGFMTAMSSLTGLFVGLNLTSGLNSMGMETATLDAKTMLVIGALAFLTSIFMGSLQLAISIYARSFKEGQTYLSSLNVLALIPIFLTYTIDVKNISSVYFNIPLANVSVLMKEFILGIYNIQHIATVIGWSLLYIFISVMAARYMFNREEVVFRS